MGRFMDPASMALQGAMQQQWMTAAGLQAAAASAWADAFRAAQERQARLLRNAATDANRLEAADQARKAGDLRVASMIYAKLAVARPANDSSLVAQDRLSELADEARGKLREVDAMLGGGAVVPPVGSPGAKGPLPPLWDDVPPPSKPAGKDPPPPGSASRNLPASRVLTTASPPEAIVQAFQRYDRLLFQYGEVPQVKRELAAHVARQRRGARRAGGEPALGDCPAAREGRGALLRLLGVRRGGAAGAGSLGASGRGTPGRNEERSPAPGGGRDLPPAPVVPRCLRPGR